MFLTSNEYYSGIMRKNYIKLYRYSLHLKSRSLLVEAGHRPILFDQVMNAMPILADILIKVLQYK